MNKFVLFSKAKADLIKIAKYTQITWGVPQPNDYLKVLDNTFHLLADDPELVINCDYIREGYSKYPQASHVIYYKEYKHNQTLKVRISHKSMVVSSHSRKLLAV